MKKNRRIPVYVLSGFLGSGKTTVLLNMIKSCKEKGLQPGIILNELGEANVENHLFREENVFELLDGCICCTIQDDLTETLDDLMLQIETQPLDVLFIEGTGVANPLEINEVFLDSSQIDRFELMSVITVLDASHYLEYQSVFSSSAEVRKLLKEQIAGASLLVLNKTDLISNKQLENIKLKIRKMTGIEKEIVESKYGNAPLDQLFEKRIQSLILRRDQSTDGHHYHHHSAVQAIMIDYTSPIKQKSFEKWLKQLPPNVLRGKGLVEMEGSDQFYSFQYASGKSVLRPVTDLYDPTPVVILIGIGLDVEQVKNEWEQITRQG